MPTVNPVPALTRARSRARHPSRRQWWSARRAWAATSAATSPPACSRTDLPVNRDDVFLFLDIGTNGEIVIGNADWMVACACSAGPAFEGSGIKCGMRAIAGAIEQVEIGERGRTVAYHVIGGGKPAGICGSGLICLLGELFRRGIVDPAGHFNPDADNPRITGSDADAPSCWNPVLDRDRRGPRHHRGRYREPDPHEGGDLRGLRADSGERRPRLGAPSRASTSPAASAAISGLPTRCCIGMLPDLPHGRFSYIGNSALTGAYIALLSRGAPPQAGRNRRAHDLRGSELRSALHGQLREGHVPSAHGPGASFRPWRKLELRRRNAYDAI